MFTAYGSKPAGGDGKANSRGGNSGGNSLILGVDDLPSHVRDSDSLSKQDRASIVEGLQRSQYCFAPRGDTQTSSHLFNAIAAGCVPIIVSPGIITL